MIAPDQADIPAGDLLPVVPGRLPIPQAEIPQHPERPSEVDAEHLGARRDDGAVVADRLFGRRQRLLPSRRLRVLNCCLCSATYSRTATGSDLPYSRNAQPMALRRKNPRSLKLGSMHAYSSGWSVVFLKRT